MKHKLLFTFFCFLLFSKLSYSQTYVDIDATGNNDGTSWTNAYNNIQDALDAVAEDGEIWVAEGTYLPTNSPNGSANTRNFSFHLDKNLKIYGGFTGTETNLSERTSGHPTILSGDLGTVNDTTDNAYHVLITANLDTSTIIDGFTITGAFADGNNITYSGNTYFGFFGGGMYNISSSPTIQNITFSNNTVVKGGGAIYNRGSSSPILNNVTITNNTAFSFADVWGGGGMANFLSSSPILNNVTFYNNITYGGGAGMLNNSSSSPILNNVTFYNNTANSRGVGGISNYSSTVTLNNTVFYNNTNNKGISDVINTNTASGNNNASDGTNAPGVTVTLTADPFVNSADIDGADDILGTPDDGLAPASTSPLINAGNNTYNSTTTDIAGNARISQTTIDIGAYEFAPPTFLYVDIDATGNNDGTSWTDAYTNLQDAIDAIAEDGEIWVAEGTYLPTNAPNGSANTRDYAFHLDKNLKIYGGFIGTETNLNERTIGHPTILSGDLGTAGNNSDNTYHVLVTANLDTTTIIDGFTITEGNANGTSSISFSGRSCFRFSGGGISNYNSSPNLVNITITSNIANLEGGGIFNWTSSPILNNIHVYNNTAEYAGGGMLNGSSSSPILNNVNFYNNVSNNFGGGMLNISSSSPVLNNVTFYNNTANDTGGGISNINSSSPTINNTVFYNNIDSNGINDIFNNFGSASGNNNASDGTNAPNITVTLTADPFVNSADTDGADNILGTADDGLIPASISPLVNAGNNTFNSSTNDIAGNARVSDGTIDIGAYETTINSLLFIEDQTVGTNANFCGATLADYTNVPTISSATITQTPVAGTNINFGTNTVTLTAMDTNGDTATFSFNVIVEDKIAPTVITQDIMVQLDGSGNISITAAQIDNGSSDNCGVQSVSLDTSSFDCTKIGANTVSLTVTDVNGNSDSKTATVTVEDKIAPTVITQDITVQLDGSGNVSITAAQIDNGSSDNCGVQSVSLDTTSFDCTKIGANTVSLTVTDVNGNSDSKTATVTVEDKIAPTVITQDITVQLDGSGNASITAAQIDNGSSDNCGIQSISLDTSSFDCTKIGANTVSLTVTDVNGNSDSKTATVTVEDKIAPTVITQDITVQLDGSGNVSITAAQIDNGSTDNCGVQSMSLDVTSFDCTKIGTNTITLTVIDVNGNSETNTATVTVEDKIAPTVITQDITVQLDGSGNVSITAAQIDNGSSDNCGVQSVSLDITSFDCTKIGANTVSLTVTDVNGNSDSKTATVTVEDKIAPTVITQDITVQLDGSGNASITAAQIDNGSSDNCGIQSVSLDITSFDCTKIGLNTVSLTVTDVNGNSDTNTAMVTVEDNVAPMVNCVAPFTLPLDATGNAVITISDVDAGSTDNCGVASTSIDKTTFDCTNIGGNIVTLTVTDISGNINTCSTTVTIVDTIAPVANCVAPFTVPLDATGTAVLSPQDINLGSLDECNLASLQIDRQLFTLDDLGEQMITLTVTDHGGNTSSCTTIITVVDVTPPVITLVGDDPQIISLGDPYTELGATTDDGSSVSIDTSAYQSELGEYIIRYSATDPSGNRAEVTRRVIVEERDEFVFEIYPNPAIDHFLIIGSKDMYFFEIYDMAGRKIQSYPKEFVGQRIPVDQYPPGMYWVKGYFLSKDSRYEQIMIKGR